VVFIVSFFVWVSSEMLYVCVQIYIILQHRSISAIVNSELRLQKGIVNYRVITRVGIIICVSERYSVIQLHS
jgi:hypothetical protein